MKLISLLLLLPLFTLSQPKLNKDGFVIGLSHQIAYLGEKYAFECTLSPIEIIKKETTVIVYGIKKCENSNKNHYKVFYNDHKYLVAINEITILPENVDFINNLDSIQSAEMELKIDNFSTEMSLEKIINDKSLIDNGRQAGLIIGYCKLFDQSEYTNGTGWRISIINTNKKTIKYIWFNLTGINAVKDIVSTKTVKGIGPIEYEHGGKYSYDYVWMTDIVQDFKLSIKIQYMDGTFKTIPNAEKIILPDELYDSLLFEE